MGITYKYSKEKDIWCLLRKGKASNNSPHATEVYKQLVKTYGYNPSEKETSALIGKYFLENEINPKEVADKYKKIGILFQMISKIELKRFLIHPYHKILMRT